MGHALDPDFFMCCLGVILHNFESHLLKEKHDS